ncbi:flap endonuclease GEN-like 1 isoform X1 [Dendrobium catenatum]|uniref:flap endonuclease GEN-like 1 isoform X1 n=1 Tax=Dendrobium catenatum TaxID=906689 RepID=UPI0009F1E518|nr:flap endonuclease GEN-like 1 isoform X1 [Dendrobium catenatum]
MGVGGNFWDLLKPYARFEGVDFLRNKRVAVDLSFWIVQHDAAIRSKYPRARCPHLRITFFRTLALFTKLGAFPVFVVDGEPSPLKDQARMERFLRGSGLELSVLLKPPETVAGQAAPAAKRRNRVFSTWVQQCVELLEILGMPVLKAQSEAEALCAQLNYEGHVDACITSDSDAFLFGAKCVIKCLRSNSKEPFECYYLSDIEAGLGLKRKQMVAIALLVGNDHHLQGVPGFGAETALRFVKLFSDDDVLDRLSEVGRGIIPAFQEGIEASLEHDATSPYEGVATTRFPHCSQCGHPGSKRAHLKIACEYCLNSGSESCMMKSTGFKCYCSPCREDLLVKEQKKQENWQLKACQKIAAEHGFPNKEIIEMYLNASGRDDEGNCTPLLRWDKPRVENLVDFLAFHQHWEPSYIRQRILPMLSTIYLREMASTSEVGLLLHDQYEFHSIDRVKIRYGCPYYLVKWKKAIHSLDYVTQNISNEELESEQTESTITDEFVDSIDGPDVPTIIVDDGCWYLVTEENTELVQAAFPKAVEKFLQEKQLKETKSSPRKSSKSKADSESPKSSGVQLSITEFYRSTKPVARASQTKDKQKNLEVEDSNKSRKRPPNLDQEIPKSVRRRLLFD